MKVSGKQVAAARDLLGITQAELGDAVGVGRLVVARFEAGMAEPYRRNLDKICAELERRGIEFTNGDGNGIGVRLNFAKAEAFARADSKAVH